MQSFIVKRTTYIFILAVLLFVVITTFFWTSSRYPALDDKALMAGSIQLEDPLSFEAHWPIEAEFSVWKKISYTTLNWMHTNRKGMLFGILMGSIFLTLMRYMNRLSFKNTFMNSSLGLLVGTPLGVCVNCAAPIAKGMYSGGARAETVLAAMIASPTLNIVVLSMLFSIMPFYMAATKVALSLFVIVLGVPLICRFLPTSQLQLPQDQQRACPIPLAEDTRREALGESLKGFISDFGADLWYIIRLTLPLMILAGFLGAVVATFVPLELLNDLRFGIIGLLIVALIGTFLPVPIAFDVVICGALLAAGLNVGYVMTLLFTLGIFSIYSFFIVGQSISLRAATLISLLVITLGGLSGFGVQHWHNMETARALKTLTGSTSEVTESPVSTASASGFKTPVLRAEKQALTPESEILIERLVFAPKSAPGPLPFTHKEAHEIGIDQGIEFSFKDMWPPFWEGRSISAGDIDKDGDLDILIASTRQGLYLYLNEGQGKFKAADIGINAIKELPIFNAVLVDINDDGWLDIFMASYQSGNFILQSEDGEFTENGLMSLKNRGNEILSLALSFGDVDRDGDLDVALGNWAAGWYRRIPGEESRNRVVFNEDGEMSGELSRDLTGLPGETLSILLSDLNQDGYLDLLVGNDFELPDVYYYGNGEGDFTRIIRADGIIPFTTTTTMALKTGDLNNDAVPELYMAQIAGRSSGISDRLNMRDISLYCSGVTRPADKLICEENMEIKQWYKSGNNFDPSYADKCETLTGDYKTECKAMLVKDLAIQGEDASICNFIQDGQSQAKALCNVHFLPPKYPTQAEMNENFPQIKDRNVLMSRQDDGVYEDTSVTQGLEVGGWSWDTKFADLDNDSWQDVYIVNGTWVPNEVTPSNLYFHNQGQGKFAEKAEEFGLDDYLITAAAITADIDNDGDLDIISVPVNGPVQSFLNNAQTGNAIKFQIRDSVGNHYGIGTHIEIRYGEKGEYKQMREIQLGGGFQSFDAADVHFGLGSYETINEVIFRWADGQESRITEPLSFGATYRISRQSVP